MSGMSIQHNLSAMNADRYLGVTTGQKAKSSEKLSSGYQINRAADDAAGLSISEKMRRQIRGLTQAAKNCQDGVSLCQVADGALTETQDILQRMNELAIKAANGTLTDDDRAYCQSEVAQLKSEIDRIANNTTFNEDIYPLLGGAATVTQVQGTSGQSGVSAPPLYEVSRTITIDLNKVTPAGSSYFNYEGHQYVNGDTVTITGMTTNGDEIWFDGGYWTKSDLDSGGYLSTDAINEATYAVHTTDLKGDANNHTYYLSHNGTKMYLGYNSPHIDPTYDPMICGDEATVASIVGGSYPASFGNYYWYMFDEEAGTSSTQATQNASGLYVFAGSENDDHNLIPINLVDARASALGVNNIDISTAAGALSAIDSVKSALHTVSEYRSNFGATQNRLEHTINNLNNIVENTTAAESLIRDTDMAKEMSKYSTQNILQQAGQSVLAQANQSKQGILTMLQ